MRKLLNSLIDAIGNTPLIKLDRLTEYHRVHGTIVAKLDYLNPGFSKKDRTALYIIQDAERSGDLRPRQTVVELTSGNMGTGLAIVCAIKDYPFVAVMSKGNSEERARMMRSLGAEVILVDQLPSSVPGHVSGGDLELVNDVAVQITHERDAFRADQFHHSGNWRSHFETTGSEFWEQTNGELDGFVDFLGSGGTYAGVTKALKARDHRIRCFVVEPSGAAVISGQLLSRPKHPIQGGGYGMPDLAFLGSVPIDGYLQVTGVEARDTARDLARQEGIFGGYSAGANVHAALQLLKTDMRGKTIGVMICDSGLKYLSTDLWPEV